MTAVATALVIPSYGRSARLARCLAAVAALDPRPDVVLVVDGNETPLPALPVPAPVPWIEHIREPNRGPGHARNTGLRIGLERGAQLLAILDDDTVPAPDWFGRHVATHAGVPAAGMVGGTSTNLDPGSVVARYVHATSFTPLRADPGPVRFVPTMHASYKRACLEGVGLFDPAFAVAGEDVDHCWRVVQAGWTIHVEPTLVVGHHFPTTLRGAVRQQRGYGRGFGRSRAVHPELPGAEFVALPTWRALAGTAPHLARSARAARQVAGWRAAGVAVVTETAYRAAAWREARTVRRAEA